MVPAAAAVVLDSTELRGAHGLTQSEYYTVGDKPQFIDCNVIVFSCNIYTPPPHKTLYFAGPRKICDAITDMPTRRTRKIRCILVRLCIEPDATGARSHQAGQSFLSGSIFRGDQAQQASPVGPRQAT